MQQVQCFEHLIPRRSIPTGYGGGVRQAWVDIHVDMLEHEVLEHFMLHFSLSSESIASCVFLRRRGLVAGRCLSFACFWQVSYDFKETREDCIGEDLS